MTAPPLFGPQAALVVVDVQNDFAEPGGGLYVPGGETVVPAVNALVTAAAAAGSPVFYTQDWHPPVTPHFQNRGGPWPVHCVADSWGAALHPALRVVGTVVRKGDGSADGYSGFGVRDPASGAVTSTGLSEQLRALGVRGVVVVGLATDYCVKETALDGLRLGFAVTVVGEAIRAVDLAPGDGAAAIAAMRRAGAVVTG